MHLYVPNGVRANPPILLALHGCQGTGPYLYSSTDFGSLADRYGFLVITPRRTRAEAAGTSPRTRR
ncbi:PHB depolymerase family esterase [Kitasatospora sp. NPDC017646]|uniref:PHB depolymerase family esterase n=1 Tax=Kitasatospora sp. NPDC017646 TaxID=3364024 RepID=UPI00379FED3A